jgi:hypothetical protein
MEFTLREDGYHVFPGQNIQDALQVASQNPTNKIVRVHAGLYRPGSKRQALIWFNRQHEGIHLEAIGAVTLSAANPDLSVAGSPGHPAIVNHVVYFGEGISSNTLLRGFRISGANHFVTDKLTRQMEPDTTVPKNLFFYTDGGAVKVFGHSSPSLRDLVVEDNYSSPCGAGISVQQQGFNQDSVLIENCVFVRNRAQVTGSAVDLLEGSAARIINCLFRANVSNTGADTVGLRAGERPFTNSGVLTIFQRSRAWVENCTFTGNRNGVDDLGGASTYRDCIFYNNQLEGGTSADQRYELDLPLGGTVVNCLISGRIIDPRACVTAQANQLSPPMPKFNSVYVPEDPAYRQAGYRPSSSAPSL